MKKVNFGVLAVVLGLGAALSTQAARIEKPDNVYGHLEDGSWVLVTPETEELYRCETASDICKASFTSDPNQPGAEMTGVPQDGIYAER